MRAVSWRMSEQKKEHRLEHLGQKFPNVPRMFGECKGYFLPLFLEQVVGVPQEGHSGLEIFREN